MKRAVWIISEGSPGHVSQSNGFVQALASHRDLDVEVIETRPRLNGLARTCVRLWMGQSGRPLPPSFLAKFLGCKPPSNKKPDLLVTSGGKAVFAARALAVRHQVPLVFIGERKPYPSAWFHTVFTPSPYETDQNDLLLDRIPTDVTRARVLAAAQQWQGKPTGRLWLMVVGGSSVSHRYTDADWADLAAGMNTLAQAHQIRWMITTSRRTGAAVEQRLRDALEPSVLADAIWWASRPEKRLHALLGAAERVFVTQDSITMVTEAAAAGVAVCVVRPHDVQFAPQSFLPHYLQRLEHAGGIQRVAISELATAELRDARAVAEESDLAAKLLARLDQF